jgi:hypothetical protein
MISVQVIGQVAGLKKAVSGFRLQFQVVRDIRESRIKPLEPETCNLQQFPGHLAFSPTGTSPSAFRPATGNR